MSISEHWYAQRMTSTHESDSYMWDGKLRRPEGHAAMCLHSDEAWTLTAKRSHCLNPFFLAVREQARKIARKSSCSINQGPFTLQRMERCLDLALGFPEYRTREMAGSPAGCCNQDYVLCD